MQIGALIRIKHAVIALGCGRGRRTSGPLVATRNLHITRSFWWLYLTRTYNQLSWHKLIIFLINQANGLFPTVTCGNDFATYLREQNGAYSRIITEANIKAE